MKEEYNIVLEGTGEGNSVEGIRTWTTYKNKEAFDESYKPTESIRVIAEGVTSEEAIKLCSKMTLEIMLAGNLKESINPNGDVNKVVLRSMVMGSILAYTLTTYDGSAGPCEPDDKE